MTKTPDILAKIAKYKRGEVEALKERISNRDIEDKAAKAPIARRFAEALKLVSRTRPALITEVKKASPSKGIIRKDFHPEDIARGYEYGGAACLSVLTDGPSFQGSADIFAKVRRATYLPLLRKDFMIDPIQIAESRAMGADAVLIIMAMLNDQAAAELMAEATRFGMDALVETHGAEELSRALKLGARFIGINNRDLRTFETSLDTFTSLAGTVPKNITLVAESGIFTQDHILQLTEAGADGFLIGESLMRQDNVEAATRTLSGA